MRKIASVSLLVLVLFALLAGSAFAKGGKSTPDAAAIPGGGQVVRAGNESGQAQQSGPCGPACRATWPEEVETVETVETAKFKVFLPVVGSGGGWAAHEYGG